MRSVLLSAGLDDRIADLVLQSVPVLAPTWELAYVDGNSSFAPTKQTIDENNEDSFLQICNDIAKNGNPVQHDKAYFDYFEPQTAQSYAESRDAYFDSIGDT